MIDQLPEWQDEATGHWYQLPARPDDEGNFIESSCTAMFGYGLLTALKFELVTGSEFETAARRAYFGLRNHSLFAIDPTNPYLNTRNVCVETCIGDSDYYFGRDVANGRSYALAMSIIFGRAFEDMYMNDVPTPVIDDMPDASKISIYPTILHQGSQMIHVDMPFSLPQNIRFELVDMMGRIVLRSTEIMYEGENQISLQKTKSGPGAYFALLKDPHGNILRAVRIVMK
jgi:hypothetical protein